MFARGAIDGDGVKLDGVEEFAVETLERIRDAIMVKLQLGGLPVRAIARVVGIHHSNVVRRLNSIPPDVKRWYEDFEIH